MKPLTHLLPGQRALIVDMRNSLFCETLLDLGVFPGDMVEVRGDSDDKKSLLVKINNHVYSIFKAAAETIMTDVTSMEVCLN